MRRLIIAAVVAVASVIATAVPANASWALLSGWRFWSPEVCMAVGDTTIEAPYIAQRWNVVSGYTLKLNAENNCVMAGYPASRRFTIDTFYSETGPCIKITDVNGSTLDGGADGSAHNGWWRYTNNPIAWVNKRCAWDVTRSRHYTSAAIGNILGLALLNSTGYNSRVMNMTAWSVVNVPLPESYSGALVADVYQGVYG